MVDYRNSIVIPDGMDLKGAAPLFCAGLTAFHAINGLKKNGLDVEPGQWVAVVGCGGLGQLAIQYGKAKGYKIVAVDINDASLALAKESGADLTYNTVRVSCCPRWGFTNKASNSDERWRYLLRGLEESD